MEDDEFDSDSLDAVRVVVTELPLTALELLPIAPSWKLVVELVAYIDELEAERAATRFELDLYISKENGDD